MMQYQITNIKFDFDLGFNIDPDDYIGTFWYANNVDDLCEQITWDAGWCIESIDYEVVTTKEVSISA
jgi:hypothetical protein